MFKALHEIYIKILQYAESSSTEVGLEVTNHTFI